MKMRTLVLGQILATMVFCGCAEDTNYVISVNGKKLTKEMVDHRVKAMIDLRRIVNPKATEGELNRMRAALEKSCPDVFIERTVMDEYARGAGLVLTEEKRSKFQSGAVEACKASKVNDFAALKVKLGGSATEIESVLEGEAMRSVIQEKLLGEHPFQMTQEMAERKVAEINAFNKRVDATNCWVHAKATNVWNILKSGASFEETAAKHSEVKAEREDRGDWATLDWRQIEPDPELYTWAKKLSPGEFSPPIDADGGVMIARVDSKDEKDCKISRIFFCLAENLMTRTPEEIIRLERSAHIRRQYQAKVLELRNKAKIKRGSQYPKESAVAPKAPVDLRFSK